MNIELTGRLMIILNGHCNHQLHPSIKIVIQSEVIEGGIVITNLI